MISNLGYEHCTDSDMCIPPADTIPPPPQHTVVHMHVSGVTGYGFGCRSCRYYRLVLLRSWFLPYWGMRPWLLAAFHVLFRGVFRAGSLSLDCMSCLFLESCMCVGTGFGGEGKGRTGCDFWFGTVFCGTDEVPCSGPAAAVFA